MKLNLILSQALLITSILITALSTNAQTVQIEQVDNAQTGTISVDIDMLGFTGSNGNVASISLQIPYDANMLTYAGYDTTTVAVSGVEVTDNWLNNDVIQITWFNLNSTSFNGLFITLFFDYAGAFVADLNFNEIFCEISNSSLAQIPATYINGGISPAFIDYGKSLSIGQVCSGGEGTLPYALDVTVDAYGLEADNIGIITLNIGYNPTEIQYTGFTGNQLGGGWNVSQSSGFVSLVDSSATGFTVNNGTLITLHFDFLLSEACEADIVFETGSYMQDLDTVPIPKNLYNGWITLIETPPAEEGGPVPTGSVIECPSQIQTPQILPVVKDFCGNVLLPSEPVITDIPPDIICEGTREYAYLYTDCAGNEYEWTYTYTIERSTLPAESGTPVSTNGGIIECESEASAPEVLPTIEDVCGNILQPDGEPLVAGTFNGCQGTITYSYAYTDCANLTFNWVYTFTVLRSTNPYQSGTPVANNGGTIACATDATEPEILPEVLDVCGNILPPDGPPVVAGTWEGCHGTYIYSYTYADCAGLQYTWDYTYLIAEPVVAMPANGSAVVACPEQAAAPVAPTILDNCERELDLINLGITYNDAQGCAGNIVWTATYEDCAGANYSWDYTYTVSAPLVNMPENGNAAVNCPSQANTPDAPVVYDNCGRELEMTEIAITSDNTGGCSGTIIWTATYLDCNGVEYYWIYTYTVSEPVWQTPVPGAATVGCPTAADVQPTPPSITDNCGRIIPATLISQTATPQCSGTKEYHYTYTDCAGNSQNWSFTYTIDMPAWSAPDPGESIADCPAGAEIQPTPPLVTDNCGRELQVDFVSQTTTPSCSGTKEYYYTYTDCAGNSQNWQYTYFILPTTGPEPIDDKITCSSLDQEELEWDLSEAESFDATVLENDVAMLYTDNCGGQVSAVHSNTTPGEGNNNQAWTFHYEYIITEVCNNSITCVVTYSGGIEPVIPQTIHLSDQLIEENDEHCYGATQSITVENLTVKPGGNLTLIAGELIQLLPGTAIEADGYLHAYISDVYCENPTPLVASKKDKLQANDPMHEQETPIFTVYPNPTNGKILLELKGVEGSTSSIIEIYTMIGEKIWQYEFSGHEKHQLDLSSLARGIYIIRALNGGKSGIRKLILQ
jgi:hypothetical protein